MFREYRTICDLSDSSLTVTQVKGVASNELGEVLLPNGEVCLCQVIEVDGGKVHAVLLGSPKGISVTDCKVRFLGYGIELPLSEDLLGRTWNSLGEPIDGGPAVLPEKYMPISGQPINPLVRIRSEKELLTEITSIDGESPLHLGQARTVMVNKQASTVTTVAQIVRKTKIAGMDEAPTIVISAMGVPFEEREHLTDELRRQGLTARTVLFVSNPEDPPILRLATAYTVMTAAEYFAFAKERHVLFIEADMSAGIDAFAEAMQSVSNEKWEAPGIGVSPLSYPYADLSALRERIGVRRGSAGSITLLSVLADRGKLE